MQIMQRAKQTTARWYTDIMLKAGWLTIAPESKHEIIKEDLFSNKVITNKDDASDVEIKNSGVNIGLEDTILMSI